VQLKPGYKQTEVGAIPEDWSVVDYVSFGQVIDGDRGTHYPGVGDLRDSGHCLFLNAGNVTKTGFRFAECQFITAEKDKKLNKGKLARGDVVLTTRGTVGNFAYFSDDVPYERMRINSGMVILRGTSPSVANTYQYFILRSWIVGSQIERLSFGSAQPQLTVKGISSLKIPLPPTKVEQKAIAEALIEADALIESLEQLIAKKRQLKQGAMQELLTGNRRLPGFGGDWKDCTLSQIGSFSKGRGIRRVDLVDHGIPCIRYGEIYTRHNNYVRTFYSFVPAEIANQSQRLRKGDLLFAGSGETAEEIGKCVAFLQEEEAYAGGDIVILTPFEQNSMYLGYLLNHASITNQKATMGQGDAVVHISAGNLGQLQLHLPGLEEQTAIVIVLSDMDTEIAALETQLTKARQLKQGMMQELLTGRIRLI
jgi:type I restriction enzyme S subunit